MINTIYREIIPLRVRVIIYPVKQFIKNLFDKKQRVNRSNNKKLKKEIMEYYQESSNREIIQIINFLKNNKIQVFPYKFYKRYIKNQVKVVWDKHNNLNYVIKDKHRIYFPAGYDESMIKDYYNAINAEQDIRSPHKYLTDELKQKCLGKIVLDIGAAEGNFSFELVDIAQEIYIFESEKKWCEALKLTFKPWKNKVHIINCFVSSKTDIKKNYFSVDELLLGINNIALIKMDIEGEELNALKGMDNLLKNNPKCNLLCCCYHTQIQEREIKQYFRKRFKTYNENIKISHRRGYMIFYHDVDFKAPFLRRGVLEIKRG